MGIEGVQLLPSPLPLSPQPRMVVSSKLERIEYPLIHPRNPWKIDYQPSVPRQGPLRKAHFIPSSASYVDLVDIALTSPTNIQIQVS